MSDVIIPQTWFGNNRLIPVRGEDGRIFLWTPLVPEGEEIVLEIVPLPRIQALESNRDQVSKALCGKENASPDEVSKAIDQLKSRLAQVERERDAMHCDMKLYSRCKACKKFADGQDCPVHSECTYGGKALFEWRGVCPENTKEEKMTGFNTQVGGGLYRIQIETDRKEVYDEIQRVARSFVDSEKVVVSKNENTTVAEKSSACVGAENAKEAGQDGNDQ